MKIRDVLRPNPRGTDRSRLVRAMAALGAGLGAGGAVLASYGVVGEPETIPVVLVMALSSALGAAIGYYAGVAFGNLLT